MCVEGNGLSVAKDEAENFAGKQDFSAPSYTNAALLVAQDGMPPLYTGIAINCQCLVSACSSAS
jgi:hypothetical protein